MAGHLVLLLSDLHFGKLTGRFNLSIARERIEGLPDKLLGHPGYRRPESILVALNGDIVEGEDIFPTQNGIIESNTMQQKAVAGESLWAMLRKLARSTRRPVRVVFSPGNHGRQSKTAHPDTNWDCATYYDMQLRAAKHPNISCDQGMPWFNCVEVGGARLLVSHHGLKHLGTPAMVSKFRGWMSHFRASAMLCGHWHRARFEGNGGKWLIGNGSLSGPDDFSETMGEFEPARQVFFYVKDGELHGFNWLEWR